MQVERLTSFGRDPGTGSITRSVCELRWGAYAVLPISMERKDWTLTIYRIVTDCWKIGCDHLICCDTDKEGWWDVFHFLPDSNDFGEAYKRFMSSDYDPYRECQVRKCHNLSHEGFCLGPFYCAVNEWFDEIHDYMSRAARETRYH